MNNVISIDSKEDKVLTQCLVLVENKKAEEIAVEICTSIFKELNLNNESNESNENNKVVIIDPYSLNLDWGSYQVLELTPPSLNKDLIPYYWIKSFAPKINLAIAIGEFKLSLDKTTPLSLLDQLCRSNNIPLFITKIKSK